MVVYTVDLTLRNLPEHPSFVVRWGFPLMTVAGDLNPGELKQAQGRKQEHQEKGYIGHFGVDDCLLNDHIWSGNQNLKHERATNHPLNGDHAPG